MDERRGLEMWSTWWMLSPKNLVLIHGANEKTMLKLTLQISDCTWLANTSIRWCLCQVLSWCGGPCSSIVICSVVAGNCPPNPCNTIINMQYDRVSGFMQTKTILSGFSRSLKEPLRTLTGSWTNIKRIGRYWTQETMTEWWCAMHKSYLEQIIANVNI